MDEENKENVFCSKQHQRVRCFLVRTCQGNAPGRGFDAPAERSSPSSFPERSDGRVWGEAYRQCIRRWCELLNQTEATEADVACEVSTLEPALTTTTPVSGRAESSASRLRQWRRWKMVRKREKK